MFSVWSLCCSHTHAYAGTDDTQYASEGVYELFGAHATGSS